MLSSTRALTSPIFSRFLRKARFIFRFVRNVCTVFKSRRAPMSSASCQFMASMIARVPAMVTKQISTSLGPRKDRSLISVISPVILDSRFPVFSLSK